MKVSYVEGLANHNGPESCGAAREGGVEALTAFDHAMGAVTGDRNLAEGGGFESLMLDEVRQAKADSPLVLSAR
jgi:hypothetical protein